MNQCGTCICFFTPLDQQWEIDKGALSLGRELGSGQFGVGPSVCVHCLQYIGHTYVGQDYLLYSGKFLRRQIFAVFADLSHTAKIKLVKCFLNFAHRL